MRANFQVLVILFRRVETEIRFCVFKRSDNGVYQFLSGGGENDESVFDAAKRETFEESGILADNFIELEALASIPKNIFADLKDKKDLYTVREYSLACELEKTTHVVLSKEHTEFVWGTYDKIYKLLKYDSNRTALWELNEKIRDGVI